MVDLNTAKTSEVGEDGPTNASKKAVDEIVDDIVGDVSEKPKEDAEGDSEKPDLSQTEDKPETDSADDKDEQEEETESAEEEESEKQDDEDLIPKSKVQERIDQLTAKIKTLEAQNKALNSKAPETKEEKLERLNLNELKSLKRQAKLAQRKEDDDTRLEELIDLEDKVDDMIQNYPQRFQQRQVKNLNSVLQEFAKLDKEVVNMKGELWNTAANIYQRSSALKNSDMGQVEAMLLAAEHLQLKRSLNSGAERSNTLSRQVNSLKKKTSLEGKTRIQGDKGVDLKKLREKARTGDLLDKEEYFKEALVPEDFLQI